MSRLTDEQREYIQKIFDEMQGVLFGFSIKYLKNEDLAMDAIQETYLTICDKADAMMQSPNPKGYVFKTLNNKIRNEIKKIAKANKRFAYQIYYNGEGEPEPIENQIPDTASCFVDAEYSDAVKAEDYKLIKLIDIEGYSVVEAARVLGIDNETCKKRIQRARKRMRDAIK